MTWLQRHPSHSDSVDGGSMFLKITGVHVQQKRPLGKHRMVILKWISEKLDLGLWTGFS